MYLSLLCSMSLISPNFDVKSSFFPILERDLFAKLLEKALIFMLPNFLPIKVQQHDCIIHHIMTERMENSADLDQLAS